MTVQWTANTLKCRKDVFKNHPNARNYRKMNEIHQKLWQKRKELAKKIIYSLLTYDEYLT